MTKRYLRKSLSNSEAPIPGTWEEFDPTTVDYLKFNETTSGPVPVGVGILSWNPTEKTLDLQMPDGVTLQIGQETQTIATNNTGSPLLNGQVVRVSGATGNRVTIALADADGVGTNEMIGMLTQDIANNQSGKVTLLGLVRNINTSAFAEGAPVYLSTTPGGITATPPALPIATVLVGYVARSHAVNGSILVHVRKNPTLAEIGAQDASTAVVKNPTAGQVIVGQSLTVDLTDGGFTAFGTRVNGAIPAEFALTANGRHEWGPGGASRDTNLYRSAADTLKTDDSLVVGGNLSVGTSQRISSAGRVDCTSKYNTSMAGGGVRPPLVDNNGMEYATDPATFRGVISAQPSNDYPVVLFEAGGDGVGSLGTTEVALISSTLQKIRNGANGTPYGSITIKVCGGWSAIGATATLRVKLNGTTIFTKVFSAGTSGDFFLEINIFPQSNTGASITSSLQYGTQHEHSINPSASGFSFNTTQSFSITSQGGSASTGISGFYFAKVVA